MDGSSSTTATTMRGLSTGTKPTKTAVYLSAEYLPVAGSTFWAVDVLPATRKPGTAASTAVPPSSVTAVSISATVLAMPGGTASRRTCTPDSRPTIPRPSITLLTRIGSDQLPRLGI